MLLIWIKDVLMLPLSRGLFDPKSKGGFRGVGAGRWPQGGLKMRACPSREGSFPEFMRDVSRADFWSHLTELWGS